MYIYMDGNLAIVVFQNGSKVASYLSLFCGQIFGNIIV